LQLKISVGQIFEVDPNLMLLIFYSIPATVPQGQERTPLGSLPLLNLMLLIFYSIPATVLQGQGRTPLGSLPHTFFSL